MNTRQQKELTQKLKQTQPRKVGGIEVPRTVSGGRSKITRIDTPTPKPKTPESTPQQKSQTFLPSWSEMKQILRDRAKRMEPSMPGFRAFSNSRRKKNSKAPYPAEF